MKRSQRNIIIAISLFTLVVVVGFSYSKSRKKTDMINNSTDLSMEVNKTTTESSLSPIVIYNTHADEEYAFGKKVTDIGAIINDSLIKEGLKSSFIELKAPKSYTESYSNSREAIKNNVENYDKVILLDIHRDIVDSPKTAKSDITIVLSKNNPHYETNKKLADLIVEEINKTEKVKANIYLYNNGVDYFNQDLSKNSLLVEIGNNTSTIEDVNACINALVSAFKNLNIKSS
ncbi:stage II sporulation protein P [Clostridium sp. MSJ-11]|uniref:Stage II sporulation protein P n=1 Tax=Clostridium mobile TaxID=2841512 RepID=A0ABS6EKH7_9CLOT|nr:stage II sporulation protein P [Clostridium mobile]MBU5485622.1 stage II sporulation protein P [Clostridium mobile]